GEADLRHLLVLGNHPFRQLLPQLPGSVPAINVAHGRRRLERAPAGNLDGVAARAVRLQERLALRFPVGGERGSRPTSREQQAGADASDRHERFSCYEVLPPAARSTRMGSRAALTSSSRPVGVTWGAERRSSGVARASSAMACIARMKASSVGLLSVSVGSIMRASRTISGK